MSTPQEKVLDFPAQAQAKATVERSLAARWQHEELFDEGFVAIPTRFLQLYAHLKPHPLSPGEAIFVIQLMSFKWSADAPFPGYKRIAKRMGVSDKMVRTYAQKLEAKGYIKRQQRVSTTNRFDLSGLFEALRVATERAKEEEHNQALQYAKNAADALEKAFKGGLAHG